MSRQENHCGLLTPSTILSETPNDITHVQGRQVVFWVIIADASNDKVQELIDLQVSFGNANQAHWRHDADWIDY